MSKRKIKSFLGAIFAMGLAIPLSLAGLAVAPGSAGITFVEDGASAPSDSTASKPSAASSSSSSGSTSRDRDQGGADRRDSDRQRDERSSPDNRPEPEQENLVTVFDPELPLAALGSLPKTGGGSLPPILSALGFAFIVQAMWLLVIKRRNVAPESVPKPD